MYANTNHLRRRFLLPLTSALAACVGVATHVYAQDEGGEQDEPHVAVTDYDTVDISVQDTDLAQVLQMLSLQSRKNIITSKSVSGTVSANLYDVTFYEALDAILKANGFTWVEQGNFIYVYTQDEWEEIQKAQLKTVSRVFELDHLSAEAAIEFITPLLSERGRAAAQGAVQDGFKPDVGNGGADTYAYAVKIVVNDFPDNLDEIATLLADLDTAPQQVLVEATIVQTGVNEANAFGIDFSILADINFTDLTAPLAGVNNLINGAGAGGVQPDDNKAGIINTGVGNTSGPGGLKLGVLTDEIAVFMRVLDEVTDTSILARPKIMALNRQRAEVLVGARVGYLSTTATETTTTQTVEFLDTGIQLVFRPFISKDGTIRMELKPSVSEASLRTVTQADGGIVTIPDELTNELTTNVRVRDGQTLVLGGLFRESTRITRRQVPFLGDIPILGAAFKGQDDALERNEIIFLITPTITHDEVLWENGEEMLAMAELTRIGARAGLLPFSREKMTTSYNQLAIAAAEAGDIELALYHIRNSLRLNGQQPEMIKLRQRLSGEHETAYERSMLERVLHRDMHEIEIGSAPVAPEYETDPVATIDDAAADSMEDAESDEMFVEEATFSLEPISDEAEWEDDFEQPAMDESAETFESEFTDEAESDFEAESELDSESDMDDESDLNTEADENASESENETPIDEASSGLEDLVPADETDDAWFEDASASENPQVYFHPWWSFAFFQDFWTGDLDNDLRVSPSVHHGFGRSNAGDQTTTAQAGEEN